MQVHPGPSQPQQEDATMWIRVQSPTVRHMQSPPPPYQPPAPQTGYGFKPGTEALYQPLYDAAPPAYGSWQQQPQQQQQQQQQQQVASPSFQAAQSTQTVHLTVANPPMANVPPVMQPVVTTQPTPAVDLPPSYLGWSIFNFLCCFWPLGLAALVYSVKVGSARSAEEARKYSLTAKNFNVVATGLAPVLLVVVVGAAVGASPRGSRSNSYDYYDYNSSYASYYSYLITYSYISYGSYYSYYFGYTYYSYTVYDSQRIYALG